MRAAGLTLDQFEKEVETILRGQVLNPHVSVTLVASKSHPVSVLGAVNSPGTQQIEGSKTLFDVIAGAGGLKPQAGDTVTRQKGEGPMDLPGVVVDPHTGAATAQVPVRELIDLHDPKVNIAIEPHDQVFVAAGRVFYVIGNVRNRAALRCPERGGYPRWRRFRSRRDSSRTPPPAMPGFSAASAKTI